MDTDAEENAGFLAPTPEYLASVKVFPLILHIRKQVFETVDTALTWEQLTASDVNFSIVRPIVLKYARTRNMALVYACFVVRSYFLSESERDLAYAGVSLSRAMLCEILAMKLLAHSAQDYIQLVAVLTTSWSPLAGASPETIDEVQTILGGQDSEINCPQNALEMAISTQSKNFISSAVTQRVVNDIYSGRVEFTVNTTRSSMLSDNYKRRNIQLYDHGKAPFLDHYRLRVPRYGAILEFLTFATMFVLFVLCISEKNLNYINFWEGIFLVFVASFILEEYTAASEHGWIIYIANMWNVFDTSLICIVLVYLAFRIKGLCTGDVDSSDMAFDVLSCGACILFPRLAFFAVKNNIVVLSLRAMTREFIFFIGIAALCFSGLLFTLWTLAQSQEEETGIHHRWTVNSIAWLMVQIWFGNTYLSFAQASSFHPIFGPILMTTFAALSNTLLLTILISVLSNTVARIDANATQEYLFQFTINTVENVQSTALVSYEPPFNLLALVLLKPASWFLSPRHLHTANVFLIKLTSFPVLITIGIYERYFATGQRFRESGRGVAQALFSSLPRHIKNMPIFEAFVGSSTSDLYSAIFEVEAEPSELFLEMDNDEAPRLRSFAPSPAVSGRKFRSVSGQRGSPRPRPLSLVEVSAEVPSSEMSPLARLFGVKTPEAPPAVAESSIRKVKEMLEEVRDLPFHKLREELKELQDRQARIESLLMVLTKDMRNE
ncbi:hypothetical protein FISHEDRAFT_77952 [Fistulina hepatica ATCC 64428]|nr:hypothetical protein FISHEDRAFT_77952 [Fistulina hepatica ATCC 64428]